MTEKNKIVKSYIDMTFNETFETDEEFLKLVKKYTNLEIIEIDELHSPHGDFASVLAKGTIEEFVKCGYDEDEVIEFSE